MSNSNETIKNSRGGDDNRSTVSVIGLTFTYETGGVMWTTKGIF